MPWSVAGALVTTAVFFFEVDTDFLEEVEIPLVVGVDTALDVEDDAPVLVEVDTA